MDDEIGEGVPEGTEFSAPETLPDSLSTLSPDAPISPAPQAPSDRRCGGEEPELRVGLVGVSCVGTTTIGKILADRRGWPFFDLDEEIERHFGISIARLQAQFLTGYSYRKDCAVVLERIATANPDCVIAERTGTRVGTRGCRGCAGRCVPPGSGGGAAAGRRGYALLMSSADPSGGQGTV